MRRRWTARGRYRTAALLALIAVALFAWTFIRLR